MRDHDVTLVEPTEDLRAKFLSMAEEYSFAGHEHYQSAVEDFPAYVQRLSNVARGIGLRPDRVPESTFWLVAGGEVMGRSKLRHHLTPMLRIEGGHIGYDIRPSERQKGYGTLILKLTLEKAKGVGLRRVLLTCDVDNIASARIIEKNGGVFHGRAISDRSGREISQYWITL